MVDQMQQRVTAVLVVRAGAEYLDRTLSAISGQTRAPDSVVAIDLQSNDGSRDLLAAASVDQLVGAPADTTFGSGVAQALEVASSAVEDEEWLWLLAHDNAPEPRALAELLGAVERAPSVSVAGPKLMRWSQPDVIAEFGESMTRFGSSVALVSGELDQAQHDVQNDVLGVAAGGMLVRRSLWSRLDGFDPALPTTDAALDFSVRARLAGHRVVVVPDARVASAGGPQHFGRRSVGESRRARVARAAQLHRRLAYAPGPAVPAHWLSLLPLALVRSLLHLIAKRPASIGAEFRAALSTAVAGSAVHRARRRIAASKEVGWSAVAPLRLTRRQAREQLAEQDQLRAGTARTGADVVYVEPPIGFISGGGLWTVVATAVVGLVAFGFLLGQTSVAGGGLLPLNPDVAALWSQVGWGYRGIGAGFVGAADPFSWVLAIAGTVVFWDPTFSLVLVWLLALPLATLGAFFCARRFAERRWLPAVGALLWGVAPPLLGALDAGRPGAVIAHILLPWLALTTVNAARSWSSAGGAALLFAAVTACAPSLAPALLLLWLAWMIARPRAAHRLIGIPIPAAALFAPLVIDQLVRANPLGLLADPGAPVGGQEVTRSGVQLAFGAASGTSLGWTDLVGTLGLPGSAGPFVAAVLLLPLGALALLSLFVRGSRRSIPALAVALVGYLTAVLASRLEVASEGPDAVTVWPGSGLSLFWLGLIGAALVSLDAVRRGALAGALALGVATVAASVPLVVGGTAEGSGVTAGTERILPAIVDAEAGARDDIGTLILTPVDDGSMVAELQRGTGATLDDQSTLDTTARGFSDADLRLATLAGNLASRSGFDSAAELDDLAIVFIVLERAPTDAAGQVFERAGEALDGNALLAPVGETPRGLLWRYTDAPDDRAAIGPGDTETGYGLTVLIVQSAVLALAVLLAVPTSRRRRQYTQRGPVPDGAPARTFDEDTDD